MYKVNHENADKFVAQQQKAGVEVFWDGWTMVFFRENEESFFTKWGVLRNGKWGYANKFDMDSEGVYQIDSRNIKHPVNTRDKR